MAARRLFANRSEKIHLLFNWSLTENFQPAEILMQDRTPQARSDIRALALRASAISMGFVFFTGGWRRFYNVPAKHDIDSAAHLSGKLVEAAPGSPIEPVIHWVLSNPFVAEWSVYLMSAGEVLVGLALILGFRLCPRSFVI